MKLVINGTFGGFAMSPTTCELLHTTWYDDSNEVRTNPILIDRVERGLEGRINIRSDLHSNLQVVEIPDGATDYMIIDYDGIETCYYVLDGKIHAAR